jgi:hypothetical protein
MTIPGSLSITRGQSNTDNVVAELEVGERFQDRDFPETMCGLLLNVSVEQLLRFASGRDARVAFRGARYQFQSISADGSFNLCRHRAA